MEQSIMYRIMLYPFNKDYEPVVRHQNLLNNSYITGLVSPRGWGLEHTQIECTTEIMRVSCDYKEALSNCSAVWFIEDSNLTLPESLLKTRLEEAIQNDKKIIYTRYRNKEELNRMAQIIPSDLNITQLIMHHENTNNEMFTDMAPIIQEPLNPDKKVYEQVNQKQVNQEQVNQRQVNQNQVNQNKVNQNQVNQNQVNQNQMAQEHKAQVQKIKEPNICYDINTPVIAVLGAYQDTDKYEIQLALRNELLEKGYQVSSISSRRDSSILGLHPFPEFMYVNTINEADKIVRYNHYIKQIELTENPEVIIIGVPGGAIPFDQYNHNNFGILTYEISRAVNCDCGIMALPYFSLQVDNNYDKIAKEIYNRFRISIDYFHISAITEDITQDSFVKSFITLDRTFIRKKIGTFGYDNVYDFTDRTTITEIADKIIDQLSENCSDLPL